MNVIFFMLGDEIRQHLEELRNSVNEYVPK